LKVVMGKGGKRRKGRRNAVQCKHVMVMDIWRRSEILRRQERRSSCDKIGRKNWCNVQRWDRRGKTQGK
jgi:hypothetical protein